LAEEPYPLAPALRPIREALAKLDPKTEARTPAAAQAVRAQPGAQ
jgi:hypothetical protein